MAIKNRTELKSFFVKNAIPTEGNFADLVDSQLNQAQDGVFKPDGEPLSVVAAPGDQKRALRLYAQHPQANPDWMIALHPALDPAAAGTAKAGFGITDGAGKTRLFVEAGSGRVGVGTNTPQATLEVAGQVRASGSAFVGGGLRAEGGVHAVSEEAVVRIEGRTTAYMDFFPQGVGAGRKGWVGFHPPGTANLTVSSDSGVVVLNGTSVIVQGQLQAQHGLVFENPVAGHINRDGALYRHGGECYLTVDNNFFIRDANSGAVAATFNTDTGDLQLTGRVISPFVKTFQIDHPLDPTRSLIHACLEGPEAAVYYRGEAALVDGACEIELPPYFEALTRKDQRTVQVTPKLTEGGETSALAAGGVADGRFAVRAIDGRNPAQRFYWEVKAVRADIAPLDVAPLKRLKPEPGAS